MAAGLWWVYFPTTATARIFPDNSYPDKCYSLYISRQPLTVICFLTLADLSIFPDNNIYSQYINLQPQPPLSFLTAATHSIPPDNLSLQYSSWRLLSSLCFLTTALRIFLDRFYNHQHISLHRRLPVYFLTLAALFLFPDNYLQNIFWQLHPHSVFPDSCYRSNSLV